MAEVLMDFPQLTMTLPDGREESIMKRTTLVSIPFLALLYIAVYPVYMASTTAHDAGICEWSCPS